MYLSLSILFLSASVLSFEIIVIRLLAISHWQPFVTLAISTALLGYGISGSILVRIREKAFSGIHVIYPTLALSAALLYKPVVLASGALSLDPGLIIRAPGQWLKVGLLVLVLTIPFILASAALALPLFERESVGRYYGWNLVGAAVGVATALAAMARLDPSVLPSVPWVLAGIGTLLSIIHFLGVGRYLLLATGILVVSAIQPSTPLRYGPYKDISYSLLLPSASIEIQTWSINGTLQVVGAPSIRSASGLSTRYRGALPSQAALYRDGDRIGTLLRSRDPDDQSLQYLRWQTAAAPYVLIDPDTRIAVVGFDGGEEAARAAVMGSSSITVMEPDPALVSLITDNPGIFVPWLFTQDQTKFVVDSARSHFSRQSTGYDLIVYPPGINLAAASAGLTGTAESYETTIEGITRALSILGGKGVLSLTGWNQHPPTGRLKTLNMLKQIPGLYPEDRFSERVFAVIGWSTHTFLARSEPFSPGEIKQLELFCRERGFELADGDTLQATLIPKNLSESGFWARDLDLRPPTDGRPYPWHSLKVSYLRHVLGKSREAAFARVEWGFFFLLMVLFVSTLFTALALTITRPPQKTNPGSSFNLYFACLGVGYMAVEIAFIKRCLLVSGPPAFTSGLILISFLLGSGLGSHWAGRLARRTTLPFWIFPTIPAVAGLTFFVIPQLLSLTGPVRAIAIVLGALPTAFFMGLPFPSALTLRVGERKTVVPWAWALTGYTSVVGSSLSGVLAVTHGLITLLILGGSCYLFAGLLFMKISQKQIVN
jgi:hypothetical protein